MSDALAIATRALGCRFGNRVALDALSLAVPIGGVHALLGRNGAGKSTLLRLLLGFETPTAGESWVLGAPSSSLTPEARGRIGFVAESHPLPPWMTSAELEQLARANAPRWSDDLYREILEPFEVAPAGRAGDLSRGQRAGLALALAVAPLPELLLLDEPTAGLDPVASRAFLESLLFAGGRDLGTVVLSSHRLEEVERVADSILVLGEGRLIASGSPDELASRVSGWALDSRSAPISRERVPGLLEMRTIEGDTQIVVLDADDDFSDRLVALGARQPRRQAVGFERAVEALLGGRPQGGGR